MKILLVHNRYLQYGGEDTTFEAETKLLVSKGHEVETLIFENKTLRNFRDKMRVACSSIYNAAARQRLQEAIQNFCPDIIHVHNFWKEASPAIFYEAQAQNVPIVLTLQNFRLICANALLLRNGEICELCTHAVFPMAGIKYKCFGSRLVSAQTTLFSSVHKVLGTWKNKVDAYLCLSEFAQKKFLESSLQLSENQVFVKPNFVEDRGEADIKARKSFFLFVGRLSEEKGIRTLLEASQITSFDLEIIGSGDLEALVEMYARQNPRIIYHGFRDKNFIIEKMKQAKALLFPSVWYEGMPLVILEAFSTGLPILISDIDNLNSLVSNGYNGWHFSKSDSKSLAAQIEAVKNLDNYTDFCKNARATFEKNYTAEVIYTKMMEIYEAVIQRKSKNKI